VLKSEGIVRRMGTGYEEKLKELGIELPQPPKPVATYIPAVRAGNLLFLSGVLPMQNGQLAYTGKLGRDLTVEQGMQAARTALLNALAIARQELGTLDRITRVVKVVGHVASAEGFIDQPQVLNGASDLLVEIFGDAGRHARVAIGAAELPRRAAVEIEVIFAVV
jgi:enamine deaminase RidA (YjgF/YER057c/UK114 family)